MPTAENPAIAHQPRDIYGWRARIGYTSPPAATEVFPYEFYLCMPRGVSLVVSTLTIVEMNSEEVNRGYDVSLKAARELARSGVDLICLGGVPINRSRGGDMAALIREVEEDVKTPVTTSTSAQMAAMKKMGAREILVAHPFPKSDEGMLTSCLDDHGYHVAAIKGAGLPADHLGRVPRSAAISLTRELLKQAPNADTVWLPCPHWACAESIEAIEEEFGITVVGAHQAICWQSLRLCRIDDAVPGFGKLMRSPL